MDDGMDDPEKRLAIAAMRKYIEDNNIKDPDHVLDDYLSGRRPVTRLPDYHQYERVLFLMIKMKDKEFVTHYLDSGLIDLDTVVEFISEQSIEEGKQDISVYGTVFHCELYRRGSLDFEEWFIDRVLELKKKEKEGASLDELFESAFQNGCGDYLAKAFLKAGALPSPDMAHDDYSANAHTLLLAPFIPIDEGCNYGLKEAIDEFYDKYPREGNQGYDCAFFDKWLLKNENVWFEELAAMTASDMAALEQLYHTALPSDVLVHCVAPYLALVGGKSKQPRGGRKDSDDMCF